MLSGGPVRPNLSPPLSCPAEVFRRQLPPPRGWEIFYIIRIPCDHSPWNTKVRTPLADRHNPGWSQPPAPYRCIRPFAGIPAPRRAPHPSTNGDSGGIKPPPK